MQSIWYKLQTKSSKMYHLQILNLFIEYIIVSTDYNTVHIQHSFLVHTIEANNNEYQKQITRAHADKVLHGFKSTL